MTGVSKPAAEVPLLRIGKSLDKYFHRFIIMNLTDLPGKTKNEVVRVMP